MLLSNDPGYSIINLPMEAQFAPIYSVFLLDIDGVENVLAGGNQYFVKPQFGSNDASNGWFFKGTMTDGKFNLQPGIDLNVKGQIRDIDYVDVKDEKYILFARYDDEREVYKVSN